MELPKKRTQLKKSLIPQIRSLFQTNLKQGYSKWKQTNYSFISPANIEYTYQFLWDTAFHAIVLSHFDTQWAKSEIRTFLLAQQPSGFLPHIIFWGENRLPHWAYIESKPSLRPRMTAITQPPVFPLAVEAIYKRDGDKKFLNEVLDKLANHHRWLIGHRDIDKDNLMAIISPNESGMDELPVFQPVLGYLGHDRAKLRYYFRKPDFLNQRYRFNHERILAKDYFNVEEILFNTVFIESARALARLYRLIKQAKKAVFFDQVAKQSETSLLKKCWNTQDQIFYSLFSKTEQQATVKTVSSLTTLFLAGLQGKKFEATVKHLLNPKEFWTNYPVPSVAKDEPYYVPYYQPGYKIRNLIVFNELLWRGPTWINTNWFVVKGLRKHGYHEIADQIVAKMLKMIQKYGFREYYNPETGEGYRHQNFAWSTLILDLL